MEASFEFSTVWKVSKYGVFSGPSAGKYGPEKTPYLDTFNAVQLYVTNIKNARKRRDASSNPVINTNRQT